MDEEDIADEYLEAMRYDEPRSRGQSILTYAQREYLLGKKEFTGENPQKNENTMRQRIRDRLTAGILDFRMLDRLSDTDRELIFQDLTSAPGDELYWSFVAMIEFIYRGVREVPSVDFETMIERAVKGAEDMSITDHTVTDVDVTVRIETEPLVDPDEAYQKLEGGEFLTDEEIAALARSGKLQPEDLPKLQFSIPEGLEESETGVEIIETFREEYEEQDNE